MFQRLDILQLLMVRFHKLLSFTIGFGIDGIIFYRGIHHSEGTNEYFLESPDGSKILGVKLSKFVGRGAFLFMLHIRQCTILNGQDINGAIKMFIFPYL